MHRSCAETLFHLAHVFAQFLPPVEKLLRYVLDQGEIRGWLWAAAPITGRSPSGAPPPVIRPVPDPDPAAELPDDEPDLWRQVRNALLAITAWGVLGFAAALVATLG